jgi:general secretion pathway protein J
MRDTEQGFTLIELLVSLALLAVTAVLLLAALTTGRGVEGRAAAEASAGESIAAAHNILRDRIEAMVGEARYGPGDPIVNVNGERADLRFTTPPPLAQQPLPPQRYRLILTPAGELSLFSLNPLSTRADPDALTMTGWTRTPLLGNVTRLDISYFGIAPPDNRRRWRPSWRDRSGLPELVRIRVDFGKGDGRLWPELIIRPIATVSSACRLEVATGRCKASAT